MYLPCARKVELISYRAACAQQGCSSKQPRDLFFFFAKLGEAPDLASPRSAIVSRGARGSSIVEIATSAPNICFTRPVIFRHCSSEHKSWRSTGRWRIFSARSSASFNISRCYRDRVDGIGGSTKSGRMFG